MPATLLSLPRLALGALTCSLALSVTAGAQDKPAPKPAHPVVCAAGVRIYTDKAQVPAPYDTLTIPAPDGPVRVTSEEEAEAAELAMRGRAGSVGATAVLVTDERTEDADGVRLHRSVLGLYIPADSARAQRACAK